MGFFGTKKEKNTGAEYVRASDVESNVDNLPVAVVAGSNVQVLPPPFNPQASAPLPQPTISSINGSGEYYQHSFFTRNISNLSPCPLCNQNSRTFLRTQPDWITWCAVVLLLIVFWPLCWVPLVYDRCKLTEHFCANCHRMVGKVTPMEDCCVKHRA